MKSHYILIIVGITSIIFSIIIFNYFNYALGILSLIISIANTWLGFIWRNEDKKESQLKLEENRIQHVQIIEKVEDSEDKLTKEIKKINYNKITESKVNQLMTKINEELKKEHFSKSFLLKKLDKPIYCLLFHKTEEDNTKDHKFKPIRDSILPSLGFKHLKYSRGVYVLPPSHIPPFRKKGDINNWIKRKIIRKIPKNHRYIFSFISLIDLRFTISIRKDKLTKKEYDTLLEIINAEDLLNFSQGLSYLQKKKNISIKDIINIPNLLFLSENTSLDLEKKEILKNNNDKIIRGIQKSLKKEIFTIDIPLIRSKLIQKEINTYFEISEEDVSVIKSNALFWNKLIENKILPKSV